MSEGLSSAAQLLAQHLEADEQREGSQGFSLHGQENFCYHRKWGFCTSARLAMVTDATKVYLQCLRAMLRPVARFCLRHTVPIQSLTETAKTVFLEVAAEEMERSGERVNVSRLSVMTGLHRRDVMRIYREGRSVEGVGSISTRVIGQWEQDPRFLTSSRKPRILTVEGDQSEFRQLVKSVSSDVNAGTVLFELERIGAVERVAKGLKLHRRAHVIRHDPVESFAVLGKDMEDLIGAVEENALNEPELRHLHARTEYDNIRPDALPQIKQWLLKEGGAFHLRARNFLAKFDLDINPAPGVKGGAKVVLGTFSRSDSVSEEEVDSAAERE